MPVGHHHLFVGLHIIEDWLSNRSRRGSQVDLDLGEVQVWEHKGGLFANVLNLSLL